MAKGSQSISALTLRIQPGDAGSLADWPIIAQIIDAAPLPVPYENWDR
jgi:hypothetical protein